MKKSPKKYKGLGISILISIFMASGIVTIINFHGILHDFFERWWNAFSKVIFIAFFVMIATYDRIIEK